MLVARWLEAYLKMDCTRPLQFPGYLIEGPLARLTLRRHFRAMDAGAATEWRGRFGELDAANGSLSMAPNEAAAGAGGAGPGFCAFLSGQPTYIGTPGMDAVCQHLARAPGLEVSWNTRVRPSCSCPSIICIFQPSLVRLGLSDAPSTGAVMLAIACCVLCKEAELYAPS